LWSIFRFLLPGLLGTRVGFEASLTTDRAGTMDRLRAQLAPFILRRTKNEVATVQRDHRVCTAAREASDDNVARLSKGRVRRVREVVRNRERGERVVEAAADRKVTLEYKLADFMLSGPAGLLDADGGALVIHEKADDYKTDPSGNSGKRILCGVFKSGNRG
jgi:hypothetical protein